MQELGEEAITKKFVIASSVVAGNFYCKLLLMAVANCLRKSSC